MTQVDHKKNLLPLDQAIEALLSMATPLEVEKAVPLSHTDARVLAQDLYSSLNVPGFDNSAMDGYAVRLADLQPAVAKSTEKTTAATLPIAFRVAAGDAVAPLPIGSVARIFTGAPMPQGADTVVMQEDVEVLDAPPMAAVAASANVEGAAALSTSIVAPLGYFRLKVGDKNSIKVGQHARKCGSDIALGSLALARGTRLGPAELGLVASLGFDSLSLGAKPRVCLFSTGNELCMPGSVAPDQLPQGAIFNSNRFFLQASLERLGCIVTDGGNLPDDLDATQNALRLAAQSHDVLLSSGGVSVGEADYVKTAVATLGALKLWRLAIKPGKPFAYGTVGAAHFIGLPGNPVSSYVTFLLLVRPFLLRLQGQEDVTPWSEQVQADFALRADTRRNFMRVRRDANQRVQLFSDQSSGVLTSVIWGDGLLDVPIGCAIQPGDSLRFLPFSGFF